LKKKPLKAYSNQEFLNSKSARELRILAEYLEPKARLEAQGVEDTIVFFGSARFKEGTRWYDDARQLAFRLAQWSAALPSSRCRFVVSSGGGPGIMEAANRGAHEAKAQTMGFGISLPREEYENPYLTPELALHFHYFFMRKFWLAYLAKAVIVFPGGYGTLDELFEVLTLVQTKKMTKPMPVVLFGDSYWKEVVNFDALVRAGTIDAKDVELFYRTESVDEAFTWVTTQLTTHALDKPGARL